MIGFVATGADAPAEAPTTTTQSVVYGQAKAKVLEQASVVAKTILYSFPSNLLHNFNAICEQNNLDSLSAHIGVEIVNGVNYYL